MKYIKLFSYSLLTFLTLYLFGCIAEANTCLHCWEQSTRTTISIISGIIITLYLLFFIAIHKELE